MFNGLAVRLSVFRRPMVSLKVVFFRIGYLTYTLMTWVSPFPTPMPALNLAGCLLIIFLMLMIWPSLVPRHPGYRNCSIFPQVMLLNMTSSTMLRKRNAWLYRQPNLNWKTLLVVFLNGAKLQYVDSYKYLGMFIMFVMMTSTSLDNSNMSYFGQISWWGHFHHVL